MNVLQKRLDGHGCRMRHVVASNGGVYFGNRAVPAIVLLGGFILVFSVADVYGASTTITLDSLPDVIYAGSQVIFTGTLTSGGALLSGGTVTICEDDPFVPDECLASGVTDQSELCVIILLTCKSDSAHGELYVTL